MSKIHRSLGLIVSRNLGFLKHLYPKQVPTNNLRRNDTFEKCKVNPVYHSAESLSFLGPRIWDLVPVELKQSDAFYSFKSKIKNWVPFECSCRLRKTYIQQVGFL